MKYYTPTKLSENIKETPEGYLVCEGVSIARTGEMVYGKDETPLEADENGQISIDRDEDEVFSPETIASFEGKALTILHPNEFVNPENWKELAKGIIQNVRRGEGDQKDDLIADILVTDKQAITLVKNGLREVSCGYEADYKQTGKGKGKQQKIIGNHLALVEQGRAGSSYAINDHNGKVKQMSVKDKVKAIFGKAQDEAMEAIKDAGGPEVTAENKKAGIEGKGYDELVKTVKDLGEQIAAMKPKGKDAEGEAEAGQGEKKKPAPKVEGAYDEDEESEDAEESDMEMRLKKVEMMLSKLMEGKDADMMADEDMSDEDSDDEDMEESKDEDMKDEACDEEEEPKKAKAGDTASRAEILAPGLKAAKNVKVKALKTAFATKDGKEIITSLCGGKAPNFKSQKVVDSLFIAASDVLKLTRNSALASTKVTDGHSVLENKGPMTAEQMNEVNAKFYGKK